MIRLSILALCYNHESFLEDALSSLANLPDWIEVLIADDASTDRSAEVLKTWENKFPEWTFVYHKENKGNCRTFNELLDRARGNWVLDFATDDELMPDMLPGWLAFAESNPDCGFCFADAWIFEDRHSEQKRFFEKSEIDSFKRRIILKEFFRNDFICPPAVLFSRTALLEAGGYNENLSYEDLNIWLRLARKHPVCFHDAPVIRYRKHANSMSALIYLGKNRRHLQSTLEILKEVMQWPELQPAPMELIRFIRYHVRLCFFLQFKTEAAGFFGLLKHTAAADRADFFWFAFSDKAPGLPKLYHWLKNRKAGF